MALMNVENPASLFWGGYNIVSVMMKCELHIRR